MRIDTKKDNRTEHKFILETRYDVRFRSYRLKLGDLNIHCKAKYSQTLNTEKLKSLAVSAGNANTFRIHKAFPATYPAQHIRQHTLRTTAKRIKGIFLYSFGKFLF